MTVDRKNGDNLRVTRKFIAGICDLIVGARTNVARGVDLVQVHTNFEIGHRIVEEEQRGKDRATYGAEVIKVLAERLADDFGKGFSASNLAYMRTFYLQYQDRLPIFQSVTGKSDPGDQVPASGPSSAIFQSVTGKSDSGDLAPASGPPSAIFQSVTGKSAGAVPSRLFSVSWTHYVFLLGIKNPDERSFYEIESTTQDWTVRELKRQYDSGLYERLALSRDKKGIRKLAKEGHVVTNPSDLLKEPLVLEFLGLEEQSCYSESDLETAIINKIQRFLLELGKGFLFEARQKRITINGDHFFIDLVLYNRLLRCYVLFDLKIGKLTHQDLGQVQMYVNYYDRYQKTKDENSTIGIVLCKQKNDALVEITLPEDANIHAREYQLYLPTKAELRRKMLQWVKQ